MTGNLHISGYMLSHVRKFRQTEHKTYYIHSFVWECHKKTDPRGIPFGSYQ